MGDEMQLANMTPRGRLVAEAFDCKGEEFPSDYLEVRDNFEQVRAPVVRAGMDRTIQNLRRMAAQ